MKKILLIAFLAVVNFTFVFSQTSDFIETKKAAEAGNADAQYNLGILYYFTKGYI